MSRMGVRNATEGDADGITRLLADLGYPSPSGFTLRHIQKALTPDASEHLLVGREAGRLVGFIALHVMEVLPYPAPILRITALCVAPEARRSGIGHALEAAAVDLAECLGCDTIEVTCSLKRNDAHPFYERLGYEEYRKRYIKFLPIPRKTHDNIPTS